MLYSCSGIPVSVCRSSSRVPQSWSGRPTSLLLVDTTVLGKMKESAWTSWEARTLWEAGEGSVPGDSSDEGSGQVELAGDAWAEAWTSVMLDGAGQLRVDCGDPDRLCKGLIAMLPGTP